MGYTAREVESIRQEGTKSVTDELTGAGQSDIIKLGGVASRITFQTSGNLACAVEISLNGVDWLAAGAGSTTMVTYATHNAVQVRATWTSGSGRLHIAASV